MTAKLGLLAIGIALGLHSVPVAAADASVTLTAGVVTQVLKVPVHGRYFERVVNVGTAGVAWCSRYDTAPAPNKAGSFPLAPYGNALGLPSVEEFSSAGPNSLTGFVPGLPMYCTADTGTATLTVEYFEAAN